MDTPQSRTAPADLSHSRTTTFRRRSGATSLLVAPVLFAVAEMTYPSEGTDQHSVRASRPGSRSAPSAVTPNSPDRYTAAPLRSATSRRSR